MCQMSDLVPLSPATGSALTTPAPATTRECLFPNCECLHTSCGRFATPPTGPAA